MLKLYPAHLIAGVTVYEDDDPNSPAFYVMPDQPDFRRDANNNPILKFIKYLMPVDRPDGSVGGGFLIFDSQFALSAKTIAAIQGPCNDILASRQIPVAGTDPAQAQRNQLQQIESTTDANNAAGTNVQPNLQSSGAQAATIGLKDSKGNAIPAQISMPSFTSGKASLVLLDSGGALVTKIESAGAPSLLGSMICSFTAELSPEGAAVVQQAMSGGGGIVQIAYDLSYWGALPAVTGHVWFDSMKFASFYQTIKNTTTGDWWSGYTTTETETMRNQFQSSQSGGVDFDFTGLQTTDPNALKLKTDLVNWGWQQLAAAAANVEGQGGSSSSGGSSDSGGGSSDGSSGSGSGSSGVAGGVTGANTGAELGKDTSDDGKDNVTRDEQSASLYSFDETYQERDSILFETTQQGTLPNPSPAQMSACSVTINANDPFFQQVHASVQVNADFTKFLIDSVDVNCMYVKSTPNTVKGFHFTKPDDILKFDSDTVNGDVSYNYSVQVNYQDQNQPYIVPSITTKSPVVTVDVGALGILYVNMTVSNVDFTAVSSVQVAITYPDPDPTGASVKREYSLTGTQRTATLVVIMLTPINKKYSYQVTYVMADGTQLVRPWQQDNTQELFINSPFAPRTVSFIAEGDFVNDIDNIFLRMTFTDATNNNYTQSTDFVFNAAKPNMDWKFSAIAGSPGAVTYSGVVTHKNHTTENIPETTANGSLVTFGPPNQSVITVTPDVSLIDFTQVKLIQVEFTYADAANNINLSSEIVIKSTGATPPSWTFYVRDPTKKAYTYTATYFVTTPGNPPKQVVAPAVTATDTDLVLMMPSS